MVEAPHADAQASVCFSMCWPLWRIAERKGRQFPNAELAGKVDKFVMDQALSLGKAKYERPHRRRLTERLTERLLHSMIVRSFRTRMGGRLRAAISADSNVSYDTQLFYYSFGVELFELDSGV